MGGEHGHRMRKESEDSGNGSFFGCQFPDFFKNHLMTLMAAVKKANGQHQLFVLWNFM